MSRSSRHRREGIVAAWFRNSRQNSRRRHVTPQAELRHAVASGQLVLHYQPIVTTIDGRVVGVEALMRWQHPRRGLLLPGEFLPEAEASGLILELDHWALGQAAEDLAALRLHPGLAQVKLFLNVSGRTLGNSHFARRLQHVLFDHELPPESVVVELTETALVEHPDQVLRSATETVACGAALALDDFGQGHASLARLRNLPFSILKIDRAFVSGMGTHSIDDAVVRFSSQLARELRMKTIAEGVESMDKLMRLRSAGVDFVQGFLIARPMPRSHLASRVSGSGRLLPEPGSLIGPAWSSPTAGGTVTPVEELNLSEVKNGKR